MVAISKENHHVMTLKLTYVIYEMNGLIDVLDISKILQKLNFKYITTRGRNIELRIKLSCV